MPTPLEHGLIAAAIGLGLVTVLPYIKPEQPTITVGGVEEPKKITWAVGKNPGTECIKLVKSTSTTFLVVGNEARKVSPAQVEEFCQEFD